MAASPLVAGTNQSRFRALRTVLGNALMRARHVRLTVECAHCAQKVSLICAFLCAQADPAPEPIVRVLVRRVAFRVECAAERDTAQRLASFLVAQVCQLA